jgi:hypothetical protein
MTLRPVLLLLALLGVGCGRSELDPRREDPGRLLVTGGYRQYVPGTGSTTARAEIYDWRTDVFTEISPMRFPRVLNLAALLPSGEVLVAGGSNAFGQSPETDEIYSPATGTWRLAPRMPTPLGDMGVAVLPNGTVLAVGGYEFLTRNGLSRAAQIFTPCPAP